MGMENGGKARCSTELFIVTGKRLQYILDTGEHQGIDDFLISPGKIPELFGKGKGDQVVLGWQQLAQLIIDPLLVFMVLAMRTIPVAAGMWNIVLFSAAVIGTLYQHVRTMLMSASKHSLQCLSMARQDKITVPIKKVTPELVDDLGE